MIEIALPAIRVTPTALAAVGRSALGIAQAAGSTMAVSAAVYLLGRWTVGAAVVTGRAIADKFEDVKEEVKDKVDEVDSERRRKTAEVLAKAVRSEIERMIDDGELVRPATYRPKPTMAPA